MNEITTHKINECNNKIQLSVIDKPGLTGASHIYHINIEDAGFTEIDF